MTIDNNQDVTINQDLTVSTNATVTGDLTVDTDTLFVDASENRVGVGTTSPAHTLEVNGQLQAKGQFYLTDGSSNDILRITEIAARDVRFDAYNGTDFNGTIRLGAQTLVAETGTGGSITERLRIDSSGRVGIGTSSPAGTLNVQGSTAAPSLTYDTANIANFDAGTIQLALGVHNAAPFGAYLQGRDTGDGSRVISLNPAGGNVGIGTTSPATKLHVADGDLVADYILRADTSYVSIDANQGGTAAAPALIVSGDADTGWYRPASNTIGLSTAGSERLRIDSSGRLLVGTSSSTVINGDSYRTQIVASDASAGLGITRTTDSVAGPYFSLVKSRNGAIVSNGDTLGQIQFIGHDGTDFNTASAMIEARVDGTPGANDMPGRLVFLTTADGASSSTERLRINSNGAWGIEGANYGTDGQVLQSNGDDAPTWSDRVGALAVQDTSTNTSTEYFFTNIPTWARVIFINFHETGFAASQDLKVELGSDGTYYDTGYRSNSVNQAGSASNYRTDCFVVDSIGTNNVLAGQMVLTNLRRRTGSVTGLWSESHSLMDTANSGATRQGGGTFENATTNGDIDCIRVSSTSTNFDEGRISITYI